MKVQLVAKTELLNPFAHAFHEDWLPEEGVSGAESLVEAAGRACYQSWNRPNPATASNKDYLANIIKQQHFSTFEHASATFYITGVSRSLTHELVRHRHLSYSELSQRYVDVADATLIAPPAVLEDDYETMAIFATAGNTARTAYEKLADRFMLQGLTRKESRQAARSVMPNMTETKIVVTGNIRAWRHFISLRATMHADVEIRRLAVQVGWNLKQFFPNLTQDMHLRSGETPNEDTIYFGEEEAAA